MQPGEGHVFSQYLLSQALHIDVWDGDSLLLIGSTTLLLKVNLRVIARGMIAKDFLTVNNPLFNCFCTLFYPALIASRS